MWLSCGPPKRKWKKSSFRFLFWPMKFLTDLSFLCCFPSLLFFFLSLQSEGQTALHIAAYEGDETMIKFLQAARADANIADSVSSCFVDVSIDNWVTTHQLSHKRKGFSNLVALAKLQLNTGYWQLFPFSWSVSTTAHHFTWRLNEVTQWSPSS